MLELHTNYHDAENMGLETLYVQIFKYNLQTIERLEKIKPLLFTTEMIVGEKRLGVMEASTNKITYLFTHSLRIGLAFFLL